MKTEILRPTLIIKWRLVINKYSQSQILYQKWINQDSEEVWIEIPFMNKDEELKISNP